MEYQMIINLLGNTIDTVPKFSIKICMRVCVEDQ